MLPVLLKITHRAPTQWMIIDAGLQRPYTTNNYIVPSAGCTPSSTKSSLFWQTVNSYNNTAPDALLMLQHQGEIYPDHYQREVVLLLPFFIKGS